MEIVAKLFPRNALICRICKLTQAVERKAYMQEPFRLLPSRHAVCSFERFLASFFCYVLIAQSNMSTLRALGRNHPKPQSTVAALSNANRWLHKALP
jgi:hypothetical protein